MSISRRYRPRRFAELTGQISVRETLRHEVAKQQIGHAYLFAGPRGVGKTTVARIFARALNCLKSEDGEPCNACERCQAALDGRSLNVIEMDAASHTGVDHVREAIIEHVRFAPAHGEYKVYILDEAHMLSTAAWNALLKTLEEPPSYAVFILATTELHKVPATIMSRCQRFDFRRIDDEELSERIRELAKREDVSIDESVVVSIVRNADGCVRDAETLFDQLSSLGQRNITEEIASLVIPISRLPLAAQLLRICSHRQLGEALAEVARLAEAGIPMLPLFDDLIHAVRSLLLAADAPAIAERLRQGGEGECALAEYVGVYTPQELSEMALLFMERRRDAKYGTDPRFALELAVSVIALNILPHAASTVSSREKTSPSSQVPNSSLQPLSVSSPSSSASSKINSPPKILPAPSSASRKESVLSQKQPSSNADISLADVQREWNEFLRKVDEQNKSLPLILKLSRPLEVDGDRIVIRFQYPFHRDKALGDQKNRRLIEDSLAAALRIEHVSIDGVVGQGEVVAKNTEDAMVSHILETFGGRLVEERPAQP